ncbi:VC0807 family protein [Streptomyces sp. NPDC003006]
MSQLAATEAPAPAPVPALAPVPVSATGASAPALAALAWSSVLPAGRTAWGLVKEQRVNGLAALILAANVVGLLLALVAGDPRLMLAKDSGITATVGIAVLVSVWVGRPLMTAALQPWVTKGNAARIPAWEGLSAERARFARLERMFSLMWGVALFGEAALRVVGAYTLPVDTMVWVGGVIAAVTITATVMVTGALVVGPMEKMVGARLQRRQGHQGWQGRQGR